jgi:hypothetical protein
MKRKRRPVTRSRSSSRCYKESENKRNMMIFEHEKEKAKWNVENSQLLSQQNDYLDQLDMLTQKKEFLIVKMRSFRTS